MATVKKIKLIILGSNGMLGRYIYSYFNQLDNYDVCGYGRDKLNIIENAMDIVDCLTNLNLNSDTIVFNAIGMIPQASHLENQKEVDQTYVYANIIFPKLLESVCKKYGARLFHPSTDCIFNGSVGNYTELDKYDENHIYGRSKSLGEPRHAMVIRTSIIGEELKNKRSLLEWVASNKGKKINGYEHHLWNGITCLQYAKSVRNIVENGWYSEGIYHIYSPDSVSKYSLVKMINDIYDLEIEIEPVRGETSIDKTLSTVKELNSKLDIPDLKTQIKELRDYQLC